ncbi:mandelate racemase/muconate lactonizing enzyme family protein [Mycolicibacterium sp.]|uniref:mandelate racemase/muconate lactonizing enzyme family protein n=1 Tax=Mycolicibacterium sp. TaxID=2320850 RepID=UPI0035603B5E
MSAIEKIEVLAVAPPVPKATWASMPDQHMLLILVKIWDADGTLGVGATQSYADSDFDRAPYEHICALAPRILGKDSIDHEARWRDLQTFVQPSTPGAVAAIDIALWDLKGKRAGMPLFKLLGGARHSVEAYASTPEFEDVSRYFDHIDAMASLGYRAVKFHAWNVPSRDLELLRSVMDRYEHSGITFMHDGENRYDRQSALRVALEMEELGYRWLEAPLIDYDIDGYRMLRDRCNLPIVPHGLWLTDLREVAYALKAAPWDAVRFDVAQVGGVTPSLKLSALAAAHGLPVEPQSWGYTFVQAPALALCAGLGQATYFESPTPFEPFEFATDPIRPDSNGHVHPSGAPGLGMEIDWEAIDAATISRWTTAI